MNAETTIDAGLIERFGDENAADIAKHRATAEDRNIRNADEFSITIEWYSRRDDHTGTDCVKEWEFSGQVGTLERIHDLLAAVLDGLSGEGEPKTAAR